MESGDRVEVRSRFDREWARGFEVADVVTPDEDPELTVPMYRVRRRSDGQVLPALFSDDDLREEKRGRGMWWY